MILIQRNSSDMIFIEETYSILYKTKTFKLSIMVVKG